MLPDYPAEAIRQAGDLPSLADFEGSAYRLRRIVGKLFIGLDQTITQAPDSRPKNALIGAGFIILKVDENTGAPINPTANSYSPLDNNNLRDPWIWRRTWMLTNDFRTTSPKTMNSQGPQRTTGPYLTVAISTRKRRVAYPMKKGFSSSSRPSTRD